MEKVELLICKCQNCQHWEIGKTADGRGFIECKTCGLSLPMSIIKQGDDTVFILDDHHMLHWGEHER
jgi:transcription elongation factor Elf1